MIVWLDAQLPPALAIWMRQNLALDAHTLKELGLRDAKDRDIFNAARLAGAVLISKDSDFVDLVQAHGAPPQIIWLTCGNLTNVRLCAVVSAAWPKVASLLAFGEPVIELGE